MRKPLWIVLAAFLPWIAFLLLGKPLHGTAVIAGWMLAPVASSALNLPLLPFVLGGSGAWAVLHVCRSSLPQTRRGSFSLPPSRTKGYLPPSQHSRRL